MSPDLTADKARALALGLAHAEAELEAFTGGQIDAIIDPSGRTHLLRSAQEHLQQSEQRLRALVQSVADVITVVNRSGVIASQNSAVKPVLGFEPEELLGSNIFKCVHDDDLPGVYSAFFGVIEGFCETAAAEFRHLARDGTYRMVSATVAKLRDVPDAGVAFSLRPLNDPLRGWISFPRPIDPEVSSSRAAKSDRKADFRADAQLAMEPLVGGIHQSRETRPAGASPNVLLLAEAHISGDADRFNQAHGCGFIDAHEVVRCIPAACHAEIDAACVELQLSLGAEKSIVQADWARLLQAACTLMKCAIAIATPGTVISIVSVNDQPDRFTLELNVRDVRMETSSRPQAPGFVLKKYVTTPVRDALLAGLAIAGRLAGALGGTLAATGGGHGNGAAFQLTLWNALLPVHQERICPMASPEQRAIEHLAEVFLDRQDEIIHEWRTQAGKLFGELNLDQLTITDHLPDVIAEITRDLALTRDGAKSVTRTMGSPPIHRPQRFPSGLDVGEVVAKNNLLRNALITVAERHHIYVVGEAARIINHRIDEAVRLAVIAFAAQQAEIRKNQDDEHLAFIAHDLRTPLNAISLVMTELGLCREQEETVERADLFDILSRNLHRIEDLVDRVLESNTHPSTVGNSFRPKCRRFELWPLVQRLLHDMNSVSTRDAIEVVNEIPAALSIYADEVLLSEVFQNLLGNAFKYTREGKVVVSACSEAGIVTCVVRDNGAGIPLNMIARVFDKLATDPEKGGTGLGLTIVKQIVEAHGGAVSAESTHGAGATFRFTIPTPPSAGNGDRSDGTFPASASFGEFII